MRDEYSLFVVFKPFMRANGKYLIFGFFYVILNYYYPHIVTNDSLIPNMTVFSKLILAILSNVCHKFEFFLKHDYTVIVHLNPDNKPQSTE